MASIESNLTLNEDGTIVERTSELINDGEDGTSKYIDENEVIRIINENLPPVVSGDKNYVHEQVVPSDTWEYQHGLNKKPAVTATDSAGTVITGQIVINDGHTVRLQFNFPFWGYAINN